MTSASEYVERFWSKVDVRGPDECWPWLAGCSVSGYGAFSLGVGVMVPAHRYAYELLVGPIPEGLTLDHTCHTNDPTCAGALACPHRKCCNPAHHEPVTRNENIRRGHQRRTTCRRGHSDWISNGPGRRTCRICRTDRQRRRVR